MYCLHNGDGSIVFGCGNQDGFRDEDQGCDSLLIQRFIQENAIEMLCEQGQSTGSSDKALRRSADRPEQPDVLRDFILLALVATSSSVNKAG